MGHSDFTVCAVKTNPKVKKICCYRGKNVAKLLKALRKLEQLMVVYVVELA